MKINRKLITHNGSFHADDIFATAILILKLEKEGEGFEIIRTRDPEIINSGDFVFDVGGIYDEEKNLFDHHQIGGAGRRADVGGDGGIEYAACGLVWKKFGTEVSGSEKAADIIDKRLFAPIDAGDNGFNLVENKYGTSPYFIQHAFYSMRPTWREKNITEDEMFLKCVEMAKVILSREIIQVQDILLAEEAVLSIYNKTEDKKIIVLDKNYPSEYILNDFPEPLYVVYPRNADNFWAVKAVGKNLNTFENRKNFPKAWGGLKDKELQKITSVSDAVFCHRGLFLAVVKSRVGAIKLAQIAVES